ncbi:hypothetical protein X801_04870, partial [Opisthorchis viverrini]
MEEIKLERQKRQAYSHPLKLYAEGYLYMDIEVGTPGQTLSVEVDTSFGTSLIVGQERLLHNDYAFYNALASTTAEVDVTRFCTNVGTHPLEGGRAADVLRIGEYALVKFHFQMIEIIRSRPYFLENFSGRMGLAPVSTVTTESFAQTLVRLFADDPVFTMWFRPMGLAPVSTVTTESFAQTLVRLFPDDPVFTIWFHPDGDGVYRGGLFSFGGIHDYRYVGPLVYVPLLPPGDSWTVQAS